MNAAKARLNSVTQSLAPYKTYIQLGLYIFVAVMVVWSIYTVLFPPPDQFQVMVLTDSRSTAAMADASGPFGYIKPLPGPMMKTGGEYSFQTWIYISSFNHRAGLPKHVFTLTSDGRPASGRPEHHNVVGLIAPNDNRLMIRIYQETEGSGAQGGDDLTIKDTFNNYFKKPDSSKSGQLDYPICDIVDIDLQRWLCIVLVVSGRVVDVYVDGKLARSCVCPGIPTVETPGEQKVILAKKNATFGGQYSTTRFFGYALTPARIYEIYQEGPAEKRGLDKRFGFIGWLGERLGLSIDYTGVDKDAAAGTATSK